MSTDEINARLARIESSIDRAETALARLAEAMVQIARLEISVQHQSDSVNRAFASIEKLATKLDRHVDSADVRLKALEEAAPVSRLVSGWVLALIAGAVGLLGGAAFAHLIAGGL